MSAFEFTIAIFGFVVALGIARVLGRYELGFIVLIGILILGLIPIRSSRTQPMIAATCCILYGVFIILFRNQIGA